MDEIKAKRYKTNILLFGAVTFALSFTLAYIRVRELYIANGGGLINEELYRAYGDLGPFFVGYFSMLIFLFIAPLTFFVSSSVIYGIGFILVHWKSNQVNFVKYWLVYPVFSIIIIISYYLFILFFTR